VGEWGVQVDHLCYKGLTYAFKIKTHSVFTPAQDTHIFEIFVLDDNKFEQLFLFKNIWRETLLLSTLDDPRISKVLNFGQLPGKVIYREVKEVSTISLEEYILTYTKQRNQQGWDNNGDSKI
jgi:hypothetical protein